MILHNTSEALVVQAWQTIWGPMLVTELFQSKRLECAHPSCTFWDIFFFPLSKLQRKTFFNKFDLRNSNHLHSSAENVRNTRFLQFYFNKQLGFHKGIEYSSHQWFGYLLATLLVNPFQLIGRAQELQQPQSPTGFIAAREPSNVNLVFSKTSFLSFHISGWSLCKNNSSF